MQLFARALTHQGNKTILELEANKPSHCQARVCCQQAFSGLFVSKQNTFIVDKKIPIASLVSIQLNKQSLQQAFVLLFGLSFLGFFSGLILASFFMLHELLQFTCAVILMVLGYVLAGFCLRKYLLKQINVDIFDPSQRINNK